MVLSVPVIAVLSLERNAWLIASAPHTCREQPLGSHSFLALVDVSFVTGDVCRQRVLFSPGELPASAFVTWPERSPFESGSWTVALGDGEGTRISARADI